VSDFSALGTSACARMPMYLPQIGEAALRAAVVPTDARNISTDFVSRLFAASESLATLI
jgi:hypothetical protein